MLDFEGRVAVITGGASGIGLGMARAFAGAGMKLVIADLQDYDWAKQRVLELELAARHAVIFSPVHGELAADALAAWILADALDVRLGLQLHKLIWSPETRGV